MTDRLLDESPSLLTWTRHYRAARRLAHIVGRGDPHDHLDLEPLWFWLRVQMLAYVEICVRDGWDWSSATEADRSEMAEWVAADLDLDEVIGLTNLGRDLATALCQEAGWP